MSNSSSQSSIAWLLSKTDEKKLNVQHFKSRGNVWKVDFHAEQNILFIST